MELRHLRYFVQVATDLHFARAAQHLGISQPPLSQQIRALEEELGVQLFERTSRAVALTPVGRLFLDEARATLAQAEHAVTIARRAALGELGELAIGFNASAPFIPRIASAIHQFRIAYPDVRLQVSEQGGPALLEALTDHTLDIVFIRRFTRPAMPGNLVAVPLLTERLVVAMRPDHRLAGGEGVWLRDLADEPLLVYAENRSGGFSREFLTMLQAAGVAPLIAQTADEIATLFGLAAAGLGITVAAESLSSIQSDNLVHLPVLDADATTTMWLIHGTATVTLPCRHFLTIIGAAA